MPRHYRLVLSIMVVLWSGLLAFAQERPKYKDVLLDGKPAKLNIETGEVTLVSNMNPGNLRKKDSLTITKPEVNDSITSEIESDFHKVKENETLLDIANRYHTTLTELKRINNLETTLVNKGQIILVREDAIKLVVDTEVSDTLVSEPELVSKSKVPTASSNLIEYSKSSTDFHTVLKGQTLYSLSKLYGLSINELKRYNGLTSDLIKVGQELRIANFDTRTTQDQTAFWTVMKGDTLYSIARKNGLTVDELKRINGLTSNLILIGQKLSLK
ncbi:MAG: LysM peptidoglycan-binding domain-containing protein [Bacteroidota bacterium]